MRLVRTLVRLFGDMDYSKLRVYFDHRGTRYRVHCVKYDRMYYFKELAKWDEPCTLVTMNTLDIVKVEKFRGINTRVILHIR